MDEIECTKCIYNINNECKIGGWTIPKVGCPDGKAKPMTNADRIRSMTDEELADAFAMISDCISCNCGNAEDDCSIVDGTCQRQWLEWLKQESEDT